MKYLQSFNVRLLHLRQKKKLSQEDIARFCGVDVTVVDAWEKPSDAGRCYPVLAQLLDLCLKTGTRLEEVLDLDQQDADQLQLDLPGFNEQQGDLYQAITDLNHSLDDALPDESERDLLTRWRQADTDKKRLLLSML